MMMMMIMIMSVVLVFWFVLSVVNANISRKGERAAREKKRMREKRSQIFSSLSRPRRYENGCISQTRKDVVAGEEKKKKTRRERE